MAEAVGMAAYKRAHDLSDLGAELDSIERLGVETIEIPLYDLDVIVGGRVRQPQLDALLRACAGRRCGTTVHGPLALNLMDEAWRLPRHREVLAAALEVTAALGARHYVLHTGLVPRRQGAAIEDAYARQREELARAGEQARALGIVLCVETMFGGFGGQVETASPSRLARELALVDHPNVAATIDFSHAYLKLDYEGRRADLVAEVAALAPFARHLHVHDSFGRQDDIWMYSEGEKLAFGHGDLHLPVGWGDLPWGALLEACTFPADVNFTIELEQRYWSAAQDCVDATRAMARRARRRPGPQP